MEASPRPHLADPDFDPSPMPGSRLGEFDPLEDQRLVVNPFLAVLGLIGLAWLVRALINRPSSPILPWLAGLVVPSLAVLPYLIHYHCLDCGRTGPYPRRRGHACSWALARHREGRRARIPLPSGEAQLATWGWVLGAVGVLLAVLAST